MVSLSWLQYVALEPLYKNGHVYIESADATPANFGPIWVRVFVHQDSDASKTVYMLEDGGILT